VVEEVEEVVAEQAAAEAEELEVVVAAEEAEEVAGAV